MNVDSSSITIRRARRPWLLYQPWGQSSSPKGNFKPICRGKPIQMEQMSGYLAARFIGVAAPGEGLQQFELIAEHCKLTNNDRLLIDGTGFGFNGSKTDFHGLIRPDLS